MCPQDLARAHVQRKELSEVPVRPGVPGVLASYGPGAATAQRPRHGPERGGFAVQVHRDEERVRSWIERHRAPALEASRAGAEVELFADLGNLAGPIRDL